MDGGSEGSPEPTRADSPRAGSSASLSRSARRRLRRKDERHGDVPCSPEQGLSNELEGLKVSSVTCDEVCVAVECVSDETQGGVVADTVIRVHARTLGALEVNSGDLVLVGGNDCVEISQRGLETVLTAIATAQLRPGRILTALCYSTCLGLRRQEGSDRAERGHVTLSRVESAGLADSFICEPLERIGMNCFPRTALEYSYVESSLVGRAVREGCVHAFRMAQGCCTYRFLGISRRSDGVGLLRSTPSARTPHTVLRVDSVTRIRLKNVTGGTVQGCQELQSCSRRGITRWEGEPAVLGGMHDVLDSIREAIVSHVVAPELWSSYGISGSRGILLWGPSGVGKSAVMRSIAAEFRQYLVWIDVTARHAGADGTEDGLREVLSSVVAPCLVICDELQEVCPRRADSSVARKASSARLGAFFTSWLDSLPSSVFFLGAVQRLDMLDARVLGPGRLDSVVEVPVPSSPARKEIVEKLLERIPHTLSVSELDDIVDLTHGFVGGDLVLLCQRSAVSAMRRSGVLRLVDGSGAATPVLELKPLGDAEVETDAAVSHHPPVSDKHEAAGHVLDGGLSSVDRIVLKRVSFDDIRTALLNTRPSALREITVDVPCVRWADIGGQKAVRRRLAEAVEWPLRFPEKFAQFGVSPPRGVLLYGPPGCSKTMMAKALATESGLNFISVKGPELFDKWVGESERAVREIFSKARAAAPCIVFFDEIDALAVARGSEKGHGVGDRVLSQLLTELDGVETLRNVIVVAATNRPDILDSALLRPGRIDSLLYVAPPDEAARAEILELRLSDVPCAEDVNISVLAQRTEHYSGAELVAVCREAAMAALREDVDAGALRMAHFELALRHVGPRIGEEDLRFYEIFQRKSGVQHL